ncbi:MAG TPA: hypothetical protein VF995_01770 [Actinomycetota bacterium]
MARTVALAGAAHPGAGQLALALEDDPAVERVLAFTHAELPMLGPKLEVVPAGPGEERFAKTLAEADTLVVFPLIDATDRSEAGQRDQVLEGVRAALQGATGAATVVLWSSGIVYGAHPDNPVPLTEAQPIRPNSDFAPAELLAEVERLVLDTAAAGGRGTVVLRGAAIWAPPWGTFLSRLLQAPAIAAVRGYDPPVQGLDPADAASALALATQGGLSGLYNVAPDDWVLASEAARIAGRRRLEIPERVAFTTTERLGRVGVSSAVSGELHYHMHPWVLDNRRLRAAGWAPGSTTAAAMAAAGQALPEGIHVGRIQVRRSDIYRGAAAGLALVAALAIARQRQARRSPTRRGTSGPS